VDPASNNTTAKSDAPTPAQLNDASYLDNKYDLLANTQCANEADDYLRSIARFDFAWDKTGLLESKFGKYLMHVKSPGVLTVVSKKAKLQNGFGAYQHITLFCDYDTQAQNVLGYDFVQ
jgi:hypothetical protein